MDKDEEKKKVSTKRRKKNKKQKKKFYKIISGIFLILSIIFLILLVTLKILPLKYILPIIGIFLVINLVIFLLLKFTNSKIIKFISILGCLGLGYGVYSLFNTSDILSNMTIDYKTNNYSVIVNKSSDYQELKDLTNKSIGYLIDDKDVLDKLDIEYEAKDYDDVNKMIDDLFAEEIDGVILDQSYIDMLSEDDSTIPDFKDKIRVIYEFKVNTKVIDISKDVNTTKETFIIYLSGIDTYGQVASVSRTDANMLIVVNPKTKQILMLSIPRDYYVDLYGKNSKDKLTHSGIYGIDTTVKSVENLLDIDINYYYKINFTSLINIVDSLDGVDVYSKYTFTSKDGYNYQKGYNHVNGKQALSFARERKSFAAGDRVRNMNQQALVEALFRKCTSTSVITKYNKLLNSLKSSFITNMPYDRLTALVRKQLDDNSKWNISSYGLDGSNAREYTYSYKSTKLYVMIPDENTINKAKELINDVANGKKLESSYDDNVSDIKTVTKSSTKKSTKKTSNKVSNNNVSNSNIVNNSNSNMTSNQQESKKFKITYIIDGRSEVVYVNDKSEIVVPKIPVKEGYEVLGWYLGEDLYDFQKDIVSDITLTAKYSKIENESNSQENKPDENNPEQNVPVDNQTQTENTTESSNGNIEENKKENVSQ